MPPTTQQQTQQHAQQQAENALQQLGQAHGLFSGINWGQLLPIILQLIQAVQSSAGGNVAMQSQAGPSAFQQQQKTP